MTSYRDDMDAPSPSAISAYLRSNGWKPDSEPLRGNWARFRSEIEGDDIVLEVALLGDAPDYPRRFRELVDDLSRLERRPAEALIRDIRSSASDLIRIRFAGADNGRITIENGAKAFQRTRDLLLAAACAALEKRAVYSRRKPDRAMEYLQRARFGPTEAGSFVLTVESPVPPQLTIDALPGMDPEPYERTVGLVLAHAIATARRIVDRISVTSSIDPVLEGVNAGLSSNMCEALAGLIESGGSKSVDLSFRWAASRPVSDSTPRHVSFDDEAMPVLAEMGRSLREQSTIEEFELVGPIHKLTSAAPNEGGEISVAMTDPPGRRVRVSLPGVTYQQAATAHAAGQWISCVGDLARQGSTHVLLSPHNFRVLG